MSLKDLDNIGYPMLFKQRDGYAKNNIFLAEHPNDIKELLQASKLKNRIGIKTLLLKILSMVMKLLLLVLLKTSNSLIVYIR